MFDIGWSEAGVILLIALLVIGPKDLPKVARALGQWTGKARAMAREFQRSLDEIAREAELEEVKKGFEKARSATRPGSIGKMVEKTVDEDGSLKRAFSVDAGGSSGAAGENAPAAGSTPEPSASKTTSSPSAVDGRNPS